MRGKAVQRGMSAWGTLFVLVVLAFAGYIGLKIGPIYAESLKVDKALEGVITDPNVGSQSKQAIKEALLKRLDIDDVRRVNFENFRDTVTITKRGKQVAIDVAYRAEEPLFKNISVVVDFAKHVEN